MFLRDHFVCRKENRLDGGRCGCEETNLEATSGPPKRDGGSMMEETVRKERSGREGWKVP